MEATTMMLTWLTTTSTTCLAWNPWTPVSVGMKAMMMMATRRRRRVLRQNFVSLLLTLNAVNKYSLNFCQRISSRIGPCLSMLSLAQSQISPTMPKAIALMSSAARQVSIRVKVLTSELFDVSLICWTGCQVVTSNIMQSFAGEQTPSVRPWMQRLTLSRLARLLVGFRMAQSQRHLSAREKVKYHTHIVSTPKRRPGKKDSTFKFIHPHNVVIGPRSFTGYLKACAHSASLRTKDFAAS